MSTTLGFAVVAVCAAAGMANAIDSHVSMTNQRIDPPWDAYDATPQ